MLAIVLWSMLTQSAPALETGKVIMFRPGSIAGAALGCPIRYNGVELVRLGQNRFAQWEVPPGRYILTNKTGSVEVDVGGGETRYVRCGMKVVMLVARADLRIAHEDEFLARRGRYEEKPVTAPLG